MCFKIIFAAIACTVLMSNSVIFSMKQKQKVRVIRIETKTKQNQLPFIRQRKEKPWDEFAFEFSQNKSETPNKPLDQIFSESPLVIASELLALAEISTEEEEKPKKKAKKKIIKENEKSPVSSNRSEILQSLDQ